MTKNEKIKEIRTTAKVKLENLTADMKTAIARAAQTHAAILAGMTDRCDNERFNEFERFKAEKSAIEADFYQKKAALYAETETACKEATDDPEEEKPQPVQEPTVWVDGSQHSAVVAARRMLRKLPRIAPDCAVDISVRRFSEGITIELQAYNPKRKDNSFENVNFANCMTAEEQEKAAAEWLERAAALMMYEGNSHVAEPLSRALDAIFGGNTEKEVDNLVSDNVKDRKEGDNE